MPTSAEKPAAATATTRNAIAVPIPRRMPRRAMAFTAGSSANATNSDTISTTISVPSARITPTA